MCATWAKRCFLLSSTTIGKIPFRTRRCSPSSPLDCSSLRRNSDICHWGISIGPDDSALIPSGQAEDGARLCARGQKSQVIVDTCAQHERQYQKILNCLKKRTAEDDARVIKYAEDGIEFSKRIRHKFEKKETSPPVSPMEVPADIDDIAASENAVSARTEDLLPTVPRDDGANQISFIEKYMEKKKGKANWSEIFWLGQAQTFFMSHTNPQSVKRWYYKNKKLNMKNKDIPITETGIVIICVMAPWHLSGTAGTDGRSLVHLAPLAPLAPLTPMAPLALGWFSGRALHW